MKLFSLLPKRLVHFACNSPPRRLLGRMKILRDSLLLSLFIILIVILIVLVPGRLLLAPEFVRGAQPDDD